MVIDSYSSPVAQPVARSRLVDGGLFVGGDLIFLQLLQKNEMNIIKRLAREVSLLSFFLDAKRD